MNKVSKSPDYVLPSSPADKKKISDAIEEMVNSLVRIDAEKDHFKAIQERLKDEFEMPSDLAARLAKTRHKSDFDKQDSKFQGFQDTFQALYPSES